MKPGEKVFEGLNKMREEMGRVSEKATHGVDNLCNDMVFSHILIQLDALHARIEALEKAAK